MKLKLPYVPARLAGTWNRASPASASLMVSAPDVPGVPGVPLATPPASTTLPLPVPPMTAASLTPLTVSVKVAVEVAPAASRTV